MLYNLHNFCGISIKSLLRRNMMMSRIGWNVLLDHNTVYSSNCNSGCGSSKDQFPGPMSRKIEVKYKPYLPRCPMDHDYKNMNLCRPMSPHLTIYAPTLPAMTSIGQRITGVILVFYATLIASATFLPDGLDTYVKFIWSFRLVPIQIFLIKFVVGLPFLYHYMIGIRFAMWNAGFCLDLKTSYKTAYIALALLAPLAGMFALIDKNFPGHTA